MSNKYFGGVVEDKGITETIDADLKAVAEAAPGRVTEKMEQLRVRLEQGPADTDTLADLLSIAVRAVRLTPEKGVELELVNGTIITEEKEVQSA